MSVLKNIRKNCEITHVNVKPNDIFYSTKIIIRFVMLNINGYKFILTL